MTKTQEYHNIISQLIDFREEDWDILAQEVATIQQWAPDLVDAFYDTLYGIEETKSVFHEGERPKVEDTLKSWIISILSGRQEDAFWEHQWYVALLHIKRGTKNLYMLGIINRLQQVFLTKSMHAFEKEKALAVYSAFLRISGMVSGLIAQCYDEVTETSTRESLERVGMNNALVSRLKSSHIDKMLKESKALYS